MAKYSDKRMGKEVGQASVYAPPHTMSGAAVDVTNAIPTESGAQRVNQMNVSVAGISKGNYAPVKTSGIKIRGTGAATKGVMARGPMA